jgi:hypothetical protein
LHVDRPPIASTVDERPVASALARLQAGQREEVVTLRHDMIRLDELSWRMLVLLDGTRGRAELADAMAALAGENRPRQEVESSLDRLLRQFAAHDLLTV